MALRVHGTVPPERVRALAAWTAEQRLTEHVYTDVDAAGLQIDVIVPMDEYTLDLVVDLPDGLVLVYDTT